MRMLATIAATSALFAACPAARADALDDAITDNLNIISVMKIAALDCGIDFPPEIMDHLVGQVFEQLGTRDGGRVGILIGEHTANLRRGIHASGLLEFCKYARIKAVDAWRNR